MLDAIFIIHKTELIREGLEKLKVFADKTFDEVAKDWVTYHAVKNILMEIIGRGIDINQHLIAELAKPKLEAPIDHEETFLKLIELKVLPKTFGEKIAKSAGFRNAIVHGYNKLNEYIVYKSIKEAIQEYAKYCDYILNFINSS